MLARALTSRAFVSRLVRSSSSAAYQASISGCRSVASAVRCRLARRHERRGVKRKTLRGETAVTDSVRQVPSPSKANEVLRTHEGSAGFDYVRDDHRRRIRVTVRAQMTRRDWLAIIDRQASDGTWSYGLLYDFRQMMEPVPREDAEAAALRVRQHVLGKGPRGPLAVVAERPDVLSRSEGYGFLHKRSGIRLEVFWDVEEAERWLDCHQQA